MLKISDLLRATSVKRWQLVKVSREQNIAEHSYSVALLAGEICKRMGYSDRMRKDIMVQALFHDSAEVITGDLPTPTKEKIREAAPGIDFDKIFDEFEVHEGEYTAAGRLVIKCADYIETLVFLEEHGIGRHAEQVLVWIGIRANTFFNSCGQIGVKAHDLLDDIRNAEYRI